MDTAAGTPTPDFDRDADCYRRRILCQVVEPGVVVTDLEDDFHHFRITVAHRAGVVRAVECASLRWPWSTCPDAARNLQPLVGSPLPARFSDVGRVVEPRANCSHQLDATAHALRHAHRTAPGDGLLDGLLPVRTYDVEVRSPTGDDGTARARLWVDGQQTLEWSLLVHRIVAAAPPFDTAPATGFIAWADRTLDPEVAEAGIVLRRGATIAIGRGWPFDDFAHAGEVEIGASGVCYTMTAGRSASARRVVGSVRDFAAAPERLVQVAPPVRVDTARRVERD